MVRRATLGNLLVSGTSSEAHDVIGSAAYASLALICYAVQQLSQQGQLPKDALRQPSFVALVKHILHTLGEKYLSLGQQ